MDKQEFRVGLEMIKAFYLDWEFYFSEMQIDVWYEFFKKYDVDKFKEILECYMTEKPKGPCNPKELMSPYRFKHLEEFIDESQSAYWEQVFGK